MDSYSARRGSQGHRVSICVSMVLTVGTLRVKCLCAMPTGAISSWYGTCTDVEDLKRAGEALRVSESRISKLNDFREQHSHSSRGNLCLLWAFPHFPYVEFSVWNEQMTELTGYTQEEINRLGWYQSLYPDKETQEAAQRRMARMRMETICARKNGKSVARTARAASWPSLHIATGN